MKTWLFTLLACSLFVSTAAAQFARPSDAIDLQAAQIVNAPLASSFEVTTAITKVTFDGCTTSVDFTLKEGPSRWPDVRPTGWDGDLQYTLWLFRYVGDRWVGSAFIQFWNGRAGSGSCADPDVPSKYDQHWYYAARWTPLFGSGPIQPGEQIGFMVSAGNARDNAGPWTPERSNVVVFEARDNATYTFGVGGSTTDPPAPTPTPTPAPTSDLQTILDKLSALQTELDEIKARLNPDYVGKIPPGAIPFVPGGATVVLKPSK